MVGLSDGQQPGIAAAGAENLHPGRQPGLAEAGWHVQRGQAEQADGHHGGHPAVIGVHLHPVDRCGPSEIDRKRPDLRRRQHQRVVALEQGMGRPRPARPRGAGLVHVDGAHLLGAFHLPLRAVLHQVRVPTQGAEPRPDLPGSQRGPAAPEVVKIVRWGQVVDHRPQPAQDVQRIRTDLEDSGLAGEGSAPITQPADAHPAQVRSGSGEGLQPGQQRLWRGHLCAQGIRPGKHVEQQCQILWRPRHRSTCSHLMQGTVFAQLGRHPPPGRAKAVDVVPGRGVAQRPHHVRTVGECEHAQRQRYPRPAR